MTEERYFPPESRQDVEVQLKLTPQRLESIARSWPVEEANARYRNMRTQTLVSETVIDLIGNEKVTAPDVLALAQSTACLKREDIAQDKARVSIDVEKLKASNRVEVERIRAENRLQLQRERQQHRLDRIDEVQKNWLKRELLRQQHRKGLQKERSKDRVKLEDKKARHRFRLTRLKLAAKPPLPCRERAGVRVGSQENCNSRTSKDPYPPEAPYGRDPETNRPYTKREYMMNFRRASYDIWGVGMPGEGDPKYRALNPDLYEHLIDEDGDLMKIPYHDYVDFDRDGVNEDGEPYLMPPPAGKTISGPNALKIEPPGAEKRKAAAEAERARYEPHAPASGHSASLSKQSDEGPHASSPPPLHFSEAPS